MRNYKEYTNYQEYLESITDYHEEELLEKHECPKCDGLLASLYHTEDHDKTGFHYRCNKCNHGWYIADLKTFTGLSLMGHTKEQITERIQEEDEAEFGDVVEVWRQEQKNGTQEEK